MPPAVVVAHDVLEDRSSASSPRSVAALRELPRACSRVRLIRLPRQLSAIHGEERRGQRIADSPDRPAALLGSAPFSSRIFTASGRVDIAANDKRCATVAGIRIDISADIDRRAHRCGIVRHDPASRAPKWASTPGRTGELRITQSKAPNATHGSSSESLPTRESPYAKNA